MELVEMYTTQASLYLCTYVYKFIYIFLERWANRQIFFSVFFTSKTCFVIRSVHTMHIYTRVYSSNSSVYTTVWMTLQSSFIIIIAPLSFARLSCLPTHIFQISITLNFFSFLIENLCRRRKLKKEYIKIWEASLNIHFYFVAQYLIIHMYKFV